MLLDGAEDAAVVAAAFPYVTSRMSPAPSWNKGRWHSEPLLLVAVMAELHAVV